MRVVFCCTPMRLQLAAPNGMPKGWPRGWPNSDTRCTSWWRTSMTPRLSTSWAMKAVGPAEETIGGVAVHRVPYGNLGYRRMGRILGTKRVIKSSTQEFLKKVRLSGDRMAVIEPDAVITLPHLFPNVEETVLLTARSLWRLIYVPMLHEDDPYWSIERVSNAVVRADGVVALTEHERNRLLASLMAPSPARRPSIPPGVELGGGHALYTIVSQVVLFVGRRTAVKASRRSVRRRCEIVWEKFPDVMLQLAGSSPGVGADPAIWIAADSRVSIIDSPDRAREGSSLGERQVGGEPVCSLSRSVSRP